MSDKPKGWEHPPRWVQASDEDRQREERVLAAARLVVIEAREAAHRAERDREMTFWGARMDLCAGDLEEWAGRFARFGKSSDLRAPNETPTVAPSGSAPEEAQGT